MVKLTKIYTRGGDGGETSLTTGDRVSKADALIGSYGAVDETNAAVGLARLHTDGLADEILSRVQNDLFDLGADLSTPDDGSGKAEGALRITEGQVERLEREIDQLNGDLEPLTSFVLPGGSAAGAYLHLARTIARRAERDMVAAAQTRPVSDVAIRYVNRLSDLFFVMSRWVNDRGAGDVLWVPGGTRSE